ncbi:hypothetical protein P8605_35055 [Streptomyces sp. T-3]|nr:hypothetical protein [Streptomyces sp. T-3]
MSLIRRGGALVALLLGALLASTAPAQAAGPAVELSIPETAYIPKRGVSPTGGIRLWFNPQPGAGRPTQSGVTMTVDASGLEGTVRLRTRRECGDHAFGDTLTVTCELGTLTRGKYNAPDAVYIEAVHGTPRGSHGTIRVTFSAPGAEAVTYESDVWVEGPDLRPRLEKPRKGDGAGEAFGFKPQVFNAGRFPARGFAVDFAPTSSSQVAFPRQYRNCDYSPNAMTCSFDQTLEPGQAYEFVEPVSVDVPKSMVNGSFSYSPRLRGLDGGESMENIDLSLAQRDMRPGTGPELKVRPVEGKADDFAEEFDPGEITLHTSQTADLRVSAEAVEGPTGGTRSATFSLKNVGPGRMTGSWLRITVPEGLSVVAPVPPPDPDNELEWEWECAASAKRTYDCFPENALEPGDTWRTTLEFRIDQRVRDAKGLLEVVAKPERPVNDPNRSDNSAPIEVHAKGGPLVEPTVPNPVPSAEKKPASPSGSIAVVAILGLTFASGVYVRRRRAKSRAKEFAAPEEAATSKTEPSGE